MRPNVEILQNNDPLKRIQFEISEVEKRETELRNEHAILSVQSPTTVQSSIMQSSSECSSDDSAVIIDKKDNFKKNKIIEPNPLPKRLTVPLLTRAVSTPQLFQVSPVNKYNFSNSPQKGIMQRFIAAGGRLSVNNQYQPQNHFLKNLIMSPIEFNNTSNATFSKTSPIKQTSNRIERDEKGRPLRKGFIPVEEKIQTELKDIKSRECELKRQQKLKVRDWDDEYDGTFNGVNEDDWSPINGKLSKSIDALNSPSFCRPIPKARNEVSLAKLCDFGPEETSAVSSHKLIARWETIIQEKQQKYKDTSAKTPRV
ncbi:unnamed protein product [Diamesa serratosioi]